MAPTRSVQILIAQEPMTYAMNEVRAYVFRQKALQAETKAQRPNISESTRRAWLIVAREWTRMAEREEAKLNRRRGDEPAGE